MSHVIGHLSFGKIISTQVLSDVKRLIPYLGRSHDKLNGRSFINHRDLDANVTVLITENPKSWSHFLTNVSAIIGGCWDFGFNLIQ
ncbi:protein disulfide-isomerase 5-3 [Gossypium australe]|uniref:Protein disulfide-isomerase 5-3 n=1 Tax=Gossypium australe TaxID=47621 RepID=A0A5B6VR11_9ROSI|nr:protein disulfide-isomerase 5-3 [Gossypium australe]